MAKSLKYLIPVVIGTLLGVAVVVLKTAVEALVGLASILLTSILVSITWYYADETRTMRQETQTSRLFSLPLLRLSGTLTTEPHAIVRNIGQGFARDVELSISETDGESEPMTQTLRIPALAPGEGVEFAPRAHLIRSINGFQLAGERVVIRALGSYYDAAGSKHSMDDTFSLSDFIEKCELLGVEFESVSDFSQWRQSLEETRYRQSVLDGLKAIANAISRFRL